MGGKKNSGALLFRLVGEQEKIIILRYLEANEWKQRRTADALGISYRGLLYKMDTYQIERKRRPRLCSTPPPSGAPSIS